MARVTLKSLAQALGMSVSTVSKALNDSYEISEETKARVREHAELKNYQPNTIAQTLKTGRSNTIGVIIPKMSSPFESQILEGIHKAALAQNYRAIIMNTMEDEALEKSSIKALVDKGVDGILFCPIHENSNTTYVQQMAEQIPFVIFDRTNYPLKTHKIGILSTEGTRAACRHLFDKGHLHIAILCGNKQGMTADRLAGYIKAHRDADIEVNSSYIISLDAKNRSELDANLETSLGQLLKLPTPPTAIVGVSDTITTHSLGILAQMGVLVPEQLAVIGFANTDLALSLNPSLSTIYQPAQDIGEISFQKLHEILTKKYKNQIEWEDIKLPTTIKLRKSTNDL
ncbi:LacI family DNA-binding transcriptional regulator [Sphingobacterium sp. MYb382]|uniref:LacI family DNA-binding transcriptional regulator n=1 Tax=Sphingobacterium sp. MYb382 TaxID=2745278 RepID=UPI003095836F